MSILLNNRTRLLIQGLGNEGQNQIRRSLDYGTKVVAGRPPRLPRRRNLCLRQSHVPGLRDGH